MYRKIVNNEFLPHLEMIRVNALLGIRATPAEMQACIKAILIDIEQALSIISNSTNIDTNVVSESGKIINFQEILSSLANKS